MYVHHFVYCIYPAVSKSAKLINCLKIAETSVVCDVGSYTVTVPFCLMNRVPEIIH